ncbi:MAG: DUF445 family protein [Deltaproteobacteria bacterium]|nr:DUF445 family protein [Deltaproteobacteria bacterium]
MLLKLLMPPVIGAFIGWVTNYVAIKLLFRPLAPINVFGYKLQGIIPKRRSDIAHSMAHAIEQELLSSEDIAGVLNGIDWQDEVEKTVTEVVEHRLGSRTIQGLPIIGLVSENIKYHVKYIVTKDILSQIDKKKDALAAKFKDNVDVKGHLVKKIDALDLKRFEAMLTSFIARELRHLEWLGALMGFLIGVFQSLAVYVWAY